MLSGITLGQYFPGNSFVHKLDPRSKIIGTVLFISSIFIAETYLAYGVLVLFSAMAVGISRIPARLVLKSIKPLWLILLITLLIHVLTTPGNIIFTAGPLSISDVGLQQGILMSTRLVLLIVFFVLINLYHFPHCVNRRDRAPIEPL